MAFTCMMFSFLPYVVLKMVCGGLSIQAASTTKQNKNKTKLVWSTWIECIKEITEIIGNI